MIKKQVGAPANLLKCKKILIIEVLKYMCAIRAAAYSDLFVKRNLPAEFFS